jgi:hypothetical protein
MLFYLIYTILDILLKDFISLNKITSILDSIMSSALRMMPDPVNYYTVVDDASYYTYGTSWEKVVGSQLTVGSIYRDLGKTVFYHPTNSVASPATAPEVDVRLLAPVGAAGVNPNASARVYVSLGTRVRGLTTQQYNIPGCSIAQIAASVVTARGGSSL